MYNVAVEEAKEISVCILQQSLLFADILGLFPLSRHPHFGELFIKVGMICWPLLKFSQKSPYRRQGAVVVLEGRGVDNFPHNLQKALTERQIPGKKKAGRPRWEYDFGKTQKLRYVMRIKFNGCRRDLFCLGKPFHPI